MTAKEKIAMYLATLISNKCVIEGSKWKPGLGMVTKAYEGYFELIPEMKLTERGELIQYLTGMILAIDPKVTFALIMEFNGEDKTIQYRESLTYQEYPDLQGGAPGEGNKLFHFYKKFGEDLETVYELDYHLIILVV